MEWYKIENVNQVDTPALVVYLERINENISRLKQMKDVEYLRPHVKTNKIAEVNQLMMGEGINKFKCATIAEAEMLGMIGAPDVLLAYQPVGPKVDRLLRLSKKYPATHYSCLIDQFESANAISSVFASENSRMDVYIDLNVGMNRTGIEPGDKALKLFHDCIELKNVRIVGLHVYDGHIRETNLQERKHKTDEAFEHVTLLAEQIKALSNLDMAIVAGGSPTFPVHTLRENIECSPGTFIFWDWGYKHGLPDEPFEYAALVISRVISIINENTICTDLGHKSVAAENPLPRVHFLNAVDADPIGQSEEHLVLSVPDSSIYRLGDVLYGVPVHICPTVALYERATVVEANHAKTEWKVIARDRKITI